MKTMFEMSSDISHMLFRPVTGTCNKNSRHMTLFITVLLPFYGHVLGCLWLWASNGGDAMAIQEIMMEALIQSID